MHSMIVIKFVITYYGLIILVITKKLESKLNQVPKIMQHYGHNYNYKTLIFMQ